MILLLLLLQETPYRAAVTVERSSGDATESVRGTMTVRPGASLEARLGKTALSLPGKGFHALDVWRLGPAGWGELFEVREEAAPETVRDAEGKARKAPVAPRRRRVSADDGGRMLHLVPRGAEPRLRSLRVWIDPGTGRPVRAVLETGSDTVTVTVGGYESVAEDGR
jgi:hypothetical protein